MTNWWSYTPAYVLLLQISLLVSCHGQQPSHHNDKSLITPPANATGDMVSQLSDSILVVFQDSKDKYWFGSNGHGVYYYDPSQGKNFIHYTTKQGLSGDHIRQIREDKAGNILVATTNGISKCPSAAPGNNSRAFSTLPITKNDPSNKGWRLDTDDLWFMGAQDSGVVYRYDGQSLYRLEFPKTKLAEDFMTEHPRSQFPNMKFNPYDVYSILKDSKGNIWFGTGMLGVCRYDGKSFTWIANDKIGMEEIAFCVRSVIEDHDSKFWFSNTKHRYDAKGELKEEKGIDQLIEYKEADYAYFMSGFEDTNGDLWLATYGAGVWCYSKGNLFHYPVKKGAKIITLYSIYRDRQGNLWLGTHTDGAYQFNGKTFEKFKP